MSPRRPRKPHEVHWVVPLRRVFPWWYVGGFVATFVIVVALGSENTSGVGALWGPVVGITIQQRQQLAATRRDEGKSLDRRDLIGPVWGEPVLAAIFALIGAGIALVLGIWFGGSSAAAEWSGVAFLIIGAAGIGVIALRARRRAHDDDAAGRHGSPQRRGEREWRDAS